MKENDIVVTINSEPLKGNEIAPPLEVGNNYEIREIYICKCGQEHFDVGLVSEYNYVSCYNCKLELPRGDKIHWCHPTRFKLKEIHV